MKKVLTIVLYFCILTVLFTTVSFAATVENEQPSRTINLVYDDSGSMIEENHKNVDTWCQAKYAMEVFAAMLGEKDTMNVYVMSDYDGTTASSPKLTLKGGQDRTKENVGKVHKMLTESKGTPFKAVEIAKSDLKATSSEEKWLVILTDGAFKDENNKTLSVDEVENYLKEDSGDMKTMFFGIGKDAQEIKDDEASGLYYTKAKSNDEILEKLTDIGTVVFNKASLKKVKKDSFKINIPMNELMIFAQGEGVSIEGIKNKDEDDAVSADDPVKVQYSTTASKNRKGEPDKSLNGCIVSFSDLKEGKYDIEIKNAKRKPEIYYVPNVAIKAYIKKGKEIIKDSELEAGTYKIDFAMLNGETKKKIKKKDLQFLGEIKYEAKVENNGKAHDKTYTAGSKIKLEEGPLKIDAKGKYLDYYSVSSKIDLTVYKNKKVSFSKEQDSEYVVTSEGYDKKCKPMKLVATLDGRKPTQEEWDSMHEKPKIKPVDDPDCEYGTFNVKKSKEPGVFLIKPVLKEDDISGNTYEDVKLKAKYRDKVGKAVWSGESKFNMKVSDDRSFLERNRNLLIKLLLLLILLVILIGYTPIKKRLPRSIKSRAIIKCRHPEEDPHETHARYEKSMLKKVLPYVTETGSARIGGVGFSLKGTRGGRRIVLSNPKALQNKDVKINGKKIKDFGNRVEFGPGSEIVVKDSEGWTYTCKLTVDNKRKSSRKRNRRRR